MCVCGTFSLGSVEKCVCVRHFSLGSVENLCVCGTFSLGSVEKCVFVRHFSLGCVESVCVCVYVCV